MLVSVNSNTYNKLLYLGRGYKKALRQAQGPQGSGALSLSKGL